MKILLIDDEYSKVASLMELLRSNKLNTVTLDHRSTAAEARLLMQKEQFDLILVDLNLPASLGDAPQKDGGLVFLDLIRLDSKVILPTDVIFFTGREDLLSSAEMEALRRGALLCHFKSDSERWKVILLSRINYVRDRISRDRSSYPAVDVAIVTALRKPELDAVLGLKYAWKANRFPNNPMTYHFGEIVRKDGKLNVVAAAALHKGMPSSAALAAQMSVLFRPKYLVMLGICAGVPGKTNFGDVIVADPAWDWGSGKVAETAEGDRVFLAAPQQRPLDTPTSQIIRDLSIADETLRAIRAGWNGPVPSGSLSVKLGPMASGASVLANGETITEISAQHREILAVEMEAYAVLAAAEYGISPAPVAVAMKSVCDFADSKKNDDWQSYAAYTSAAFFDQLFREGDLNI